MTPNTLNRRTHVITLVLPVVNFPFLDINIPASPAYGMYVTQLIPYAGTCSNYKNFLSRNHHC